MPRIRMPKKAIIFDLDNTIYPVNSIGDKLFQSLFEIISQDPDQINSIDKIKVDIMRRPFQLVADEYFFSEKLTQKATNLLKELRFDGKIMPYEDYHFTKALQVDKFLVTTGFKNLQQSKIDKLNISSDFLEIHIVDPAQSSRTKKDIFREIVQRRNYQTTDVLVVGDDLHSEIKAANELGIDAVLYDRDSIDNHTMQVKRLHNFSQLIEYV